MRITYWIPILFLFFPLVKSNSQQKKYVIHTVAFYNFENLFDTINDPDTFDEEWTPTGLQRWTYDLYLY